MAIRTTEELLNMIRDRMGDSDDDLAFLEDASDTLSSLSESENWKEKYETNDAEWRTRYKERFFNKEKDDKEEKEDKEEKDDTNYKKTYDDLFIFS